MNELRDNMKLEEDISLFISNLKDVEKEYKIILGKYSKEFSEQDRKQQDILHYLEFNNLNSVAAYRLMKELKEVRLERRKAEDTVQLLMNLASKLKLNNNEANTSVIINSKKQQMKMRRYKMRVYTEKQLKNIANLPVYKGGEENV